MNLPNQVLLGLGLGIAAGLILNVTGLGETPWIDANVINGAFHAGGKLFVNALKMLVVPLVLFSLIPGILGIGDIRLLGRIGSKSFALYILTTAIAISTAIALAVLFDIGKGLNIPLEGDFAGKQAAKSFIEILTGIVPANIVSAMANADMLAIIFLSLIHI